MRPRAAVEAQIKPFRSLLEDAKSPDLNRIIIELLLDIRDLLLTTNRRLSRLGTQ